MVESLLKTAKGIGNDKQIWLTNQSFSKMAKESEIRLSNEGQLIFEYKGKIVIQVAIDRKLHSTAGLDFFARIEGIDEMDPYSRIKKNSIYTFPEDGKEIIL